MLLVSGRFTVSQTIIPEAQEHFLTPSAHRDTHIFGGLGFGHGLNGVATLPNDDTVSVTAGYLPAGYEWRDRAATLAGPTGKLVNRVLVLLAGVASLLTFGVLAVRELR